jgi:hypothetical protein
MRTIIYAVMMAPALSGWMRDPESVTRETLAESAAAPMPDTSRFDALKPRRQGRGVMCPNL